MTFAEISKACHLSEHEKSEFESYLENKFKEDCINTNFDESFLNKWNNICAYAELYGSVAALNKFVCAKRPVDFISDSNVQIEIYNSFSGKIPIIYITNKDDFELFITNTIYKGIKPDNLSQTGASFAMGKSTRFIVLSSKPYSNIPASELGLSDEEWAEKSMIIRREHECTHYFTKQFYGISRNHLHDELIADFFGLYEAFGEYKAEYFLKFMGISSNNGGRLKFYIPNMSDKLYSAISEVAKSASETLERYSKTDEFKQMNRRERVEKLCSLGLIDLLK